MKNSLEGSTLDLSWQKKESVNLKLGQMQLSCLGNRKKKERRKMSRSS